MQKAKTMQWVFNKVYRHLLKQGQPALGMGGGCMYRGVDNLMCAVGCLIPDSLYSKDIEHERVDEESVEEVVRKSLGRRRKLPKRWLDLLVELQSIHDNTDPRDWKQTLSTLGKSYNLTIPKGVMNRCPQ